MLESLRTAVLRFAVLSAVTADAAILGWLIPSKEGMGLDAGAVVIAAATGGMAVWALFKVFPAGRRAVSLVFAGIVLFIASVVHPVFESARVASDHARCLSSLKTLVQGLELYGIDNDDRFPPVNVWRDSADDYRTEDSQGEYLHCPVSGRPWTYAMNAAAGGLRPKDMAAVDRTVLIFDADAAKPNAGGGPDDLAPRHGGMAGVAFADGHARMASAGLNWKP